MTLHLQQVFVRALQKKQLARVLLGAQIRQQLPYRVKVALDCVTSTLLGHFVVGFAHGIVLIDCRLVVRCVEQRFTTGS